MSHEPRDVPLFYLTQPTPCPYLPERMERKAFTHLVGTKAPLVHNLLANAGFRRSQNIIYRPLCEGCQACVSVRVIAPDFRWSKRFKRNLRLNDDLISEARPALATDEQYDLFRRYLDARHADGGMADMNVLDFASMIEETHVSTMVIEYRLAHDSSDGKRGALVAVALTDVLMDGLSMVYGFYDPELTHRGLGTYMILDHVRRGPQMDLPYVYLGYWVEGSKKMNYKRQFQPQQRLSNDGWVDAPAGDV